MLRALIHAHMRPVFVVAPDALIAPRDKRADRVGNVPAGCLQRLAEQTVRLVVLDLRAWDAALVSAACARIG